MATNAPWSEHQYKVVVEFKKGNQGAGRVVNVTHNGAMVPPQLYGRIAPAAWASFMADVDQLAREHPYTARQSAGQCCTNFVSLISCLVIGFGCFEGDGGDYGVWTQRVREVIARHTPVFGPAGVNMSLQSVHGSFWLQLDIDPNRVAVGQPVTPPGGVPGYGAPTQMPGYGAPAPGYGPPGQMAYGQAPPPPKS